MHVIHILSFFISSHGPETRYFLAFFYLSSENLQSVQFSFLVKSSSIDNISTGDVELASSGGIERTMTGYTGTNAQLDALPSKQRRDKMNNKGQQDEEEERGIPSSSSWKNHSFSSIEIIRVYDGNATFRNGTPRSISLSKQATYNQVLVNRNCPSFPNSIFFALLGGCSSHIPYQ